MVISISSCSRAPHLAENPSGFVINISLIRALNHLGVNVHLALNPTTSSGSVSAGTIVWMDDGRIVQRGGGDLRSFRGDRNSRESVRRVADLGIMAGSDEIRQRTKHAVASKGQRRHSRTPISGRCLDPTVEHSLRQRPHDSGDATSSAIDQCSAGAHGCGRCAASAGNVRHSHRRRSAQRHAKRTTFSKRERRFAPKWPACEARAD